MIAGTARTVSTIALALSLTALASQAPAALAETAPPPVSALSAPSQQFPLGSALPDTQNTGVLGWIATSMTQMPALSAAPLFAPGGAMEQGALAVVPAQAAAPTAQPTRQPQLQGSVVQPHTLTAPVPAATSVPLHVPAYSPIGTMAAPTLDGVALLQLAGKFAIVLVLLLVCLRVLRAIMPRLQQSTPGKPSAMVLHSESIGDKQRVCLLDLQVKLALVSISGSGVTPITTVEDPEKIAALRDYYRQRSGRQRQSPQSAGATAGPSFDALLQEMQSTQSQPDWNIPSPRPDYARTPAARDTARLQPSARAASAAQEGDPLVGQALMAIRGLRRKVEER